MITYYTAAITGLLCALLYIMLLTVYAVRSSFCTNHFIGSLIRIAIPISASVIMLRSSLNHLILMLGVFYVAVWLMIIVYKSMRP